MSQTTRLVYHLCHQCNAITSQLGAYLSLEEMYRDTVVDGFVTPFDYRPMLQAQAALIVDISTNMHAAVRALSERAPQQQHIGNSAYESLLNAAKGLSTMAGKLSDDRFHSVMAH